MVCRQSLCLQAITITINNLRLFVTVRILYSPFVWLSWWSHQLPLVLMFYITFQPLTHFSIYLAFCLRSHKPYLQGLLHLYISRTLSYTIPQRIHSVKPWYWVPLVCRKSTSCYSRHKGISFVTLLMVTAPQMIAKLYMMFKLGTATVC